MVTTIVIRSYHTALILVTLILDAVVQRRLDTVQIPRDTMAQHGMESFLRLDTESL